MSIGSLLGLTLLAVTMTMVTAYSVLLEANLESGLLFGAEFRLNRAADAWIKSKAELSSLDLVEKQKDDTLYPTLPDDGTPVLYRNRDLLPAVMQEVLPNSLVDGQFNEVSIESLGLLNHGFLLHLYRRLPNGEGLHVMQQLTLADHERERTEYFDAMANQRLGSRLWFIGATVIIVLLFGYLVARGTRKLSHWTDSLSMESLPDKPPALAFKEMRSIAASTLAMVRREHDAIEHQHRFLRFASHELRTPLSIASANTELLARYGVRKEAKEALNRLEDALKSMNNLTDTLLWLGRGEAPVPQPEDIDLLHLVNSIIEANQELAHDNNVVVEVVWASKPQTVQPRVLLEILCSNLISNAIRHTRHGRVDIRLSGETIDIENRGDQLGEQIADRNGYGLGLQLISWVVERANWRWEQDGGVTFHRHCIHLNPSSRRV